jgi:hypothetical protein
MDQTTNIPIFELIQLTPIFLVQSRSIPNDLAKPEVFIYSTVFELNQKYSK